MKSCRYFLFRRPLLLGSSTKKILNTRRKKIININSVLEKFPDFKYFTHSLLLNFRYFKYLSQLLIEEIHRYIYIRIIMKNFALECALNCYNNWIPVYNEINRETRSQSGLSSCRSCENDSRYFERNVMPDTFRYAWQIDVQLAQTFFFFLNLLTSSLPPDLLSPGDANLTHYFTREFEPTCTFLVFDVRVISASKLNYFRPLPAWTMHKTRDFISSKVYRKLIINASTACRPVIDQTCSSRNVIREIVPSFASLLAAIDEIYVIETRLVSKNRILINRTTIQNHFIFFNHFSTISISPSFVSIF